MKATHPLSFRTLLGILLACAITFYFFVPTRKTLLDRLTLDGRTKRAFEVLQSIPEEEKARDPEFYEVMRLRLNRQLLNPKDTAGVSAQIEATLLAYERSSYKQKFLSEVLHSIPLLNSPEQALILVAPHLKSISRQEDKGSIVNFLVKDALAAGKPAVAAETYETFLQTFPPAETNISEAVRLWRSAAKPDKALKVLENFATKPEEASLMESPGLVELKIGLLREVGRGREVFELAHRLLNNNEDETARRKWLKVMQDTASRPAQHRILLAEYRRSVQRDSENAQAWQVIAELSLMSDDLDSAKEAYEKLTSLRRGDRVASKKLAQIYEWNGEANRAFDLYLKLAEQKDSSAVERLIELNPGLYRDNDLLKILRDLRREAGQDKYVLVLARLLVKHGEYGDAESLYQKHLKQNKGDAPVTGEYAEMLIRQHAYEQALIVLKQLQGISPGDRSLLKRIAEVHYLRGDFEESFQVYKQLAKESTDLETILKYCTLAESLGDFQSLSEALGRKLELKKETTEEDFIKLAYVYNLLGSNADRRRVLERGLAKFEHSDSLRVQLAFLLVLTKQHGQALPILRRSRNLRTDPATVQLYLELLIEGRDYDTAEKFLKSGIDEKILDAQNINQLQAAVYEGNQNDVAAERIHQKLWQQHPGEDAYALDYLHILAKLGKSRKAESVLQPLLKNPTPAILELAIHVYVELGDYKEAERLQTRFMELPGKSRFQDWSYLGDIRYSAGNRSAAQHAYRRALAAAEMNIQSLPR